MYAARRKSLPSLFSIAGKALFFHYFHGGSSLGLSVGVALSVPEKALRNVFHLDVGRGNCGADKRHLTRSAI